MAFHIEKVDEVRLDAHLELDHNRPAGETGDVVILKDAVTNRAVETEMEHMLLQGLTVGGDQGRIVNSNRAGWCRTAAELHKPGCLPHSLSR